MLGCRVYVYVCTAPTYTCTLVVLMAALGVRGKAKSTDATMRATAKATVVKKPKTFCNRVTALCMVGD